MPSITRRQFVASSAACATVLELQRAAWALGLSQQVPVCSLVAEQEEGPYYIKSEAVRSDVTEGKPGVPLALRIVILDARTCKPLQGVAVDIWGCDAMGLYSGFTKENPMGPGGPPPNFDPQHPGNSHGLPEGFGPPPENHPTDKLTFLRGVQMTDGSGVVNFRTIVPGFYMGRTNHIHFQARSGVDGLGSKLPAGHIAHTGQIFLPETLVAELMTKPPYSEHKIHRTTPREDAVFTDQHGESSIARVNPLQAGRGYSAELIAALDPTSTPKPAERRGGPPPPPRAGVE